MTKTSDEEPVMTRAAAAAQWTRTYLKAHGGRATSRDLYAAGRHAGYRESTLQSARKTTEDIIIVKEGRSWVWRLATPEAAAALAENDAYPTLNAVGGLIVTGPTGTNVNDAALVLIR